MFSELSLLREGLPVWATFDRAGLLKIGCGLWLLFGLLETCGLPLAILLPGIVFWGFLAFRGK